MPTLGLVGGHFLPGGRIFARRTGRTASNDPVHRRSLPSATKGRAGRPHRDPSANRAGLLFVINLVLTIVLKVILSGASPHWVKCVESPASWLLIPVLLVTGYYVARRAHHRHTEGQARPTAAFPPSDVAVPRSATIVIVVNLHRTEQAQGRRLRRRRPWQRSAFSEGG